jgi:hypothetical protein
MHCVRLADGVCIANLHAPAGRRAHASKVVVAAAAVAAAFAEGAPLVFGGDLNLRPAQDPEPFEQLRERFGLGEPTAPDAIDHLLARGLRVAEPPRRLGAGRRELRAASGRVVRLSDHAPVTATFVR